MAWSSSWEVTWPPSCSQGQEGQPCACSHSLVQRQGARPQAHLSGIRQVWPDLLRAPWRQGQSKGRQWARTRFLVDHVMSRVRPLSWHLPFSLIFRTQTLHHPAGGLAWVQGPCTRHHPTAHTIAKLLILLGRVTQTGTGNWTLTDWHRNCHPRTSVFLGLNSPPHWMPTSSSHCPPVGTAL